MLLDETAFLFCMIAIDKEQRDTARLSHVKSLSRHKTPPFLSFEGKKKNLNRTY